MASQKSLQQKFIKTMKDPFTHECVAFGFSAPNTKSYTVRQSIKDACPVIQAECQDTFGADFATVVKALELYADLDKVYLPKSLFA